ncbi:hypothetical protein [Clostridium tertium]|uniref:hypothetical protein n=1 Tax=Clostridium tertium TaxID=1559 RepID=UPI0012908312|nr:hypothetical protein [Clostridium tertium]
MMRIKSARSTMTTIMIDVARNMIMKINVAKSMMRIMISAARNITKITLIDTARNVTMTKKMMIENVRNMMTMIMTNAVRSMMMTMISAVKNITKITLIDTARNVTMTKNARSMMTMIMINSARSVKKEIKTGEDLMTSVVKRMIKMTIAIIIHMKSIFTGVDLNMKTLKNTNNIITN